MLRNQRWTRGAVMALGLAALPLATACGGGDAEPDARASKVTDAVEAAVVAPAKVEVIADLTGCKVKIRTEADELREGVCRTSKGDYLVTTFPEEKFKEIWLDSASIYGGKYLVGPRWVISGKEKVLEPLRKMVGGTIRDLGRSSGAAPGVPTS